MSRVLLADDSPHAQRMGERLLRDEGYEVVTVADGDTAVLRLPDVDPDLLILDAGLPVRDGYEIARFVKNSAFYRHASVLLTGTLAEPVDEIGARECGADATMQKPFDADTLPRVIAPLIARSGELRAQRPAGPPPPIPGDEPTFVSGAIPAEFEAESAVEPLSEEERVRAAVTLALDAAMPRLIDELTRHTLRALHSK